MILVAVATHSTGVTSVGVSAKTNAQLPVSSLITPFSSSEVVAANCDSFPVTSALSVLRLEKLVLVVHLKDAPVIQSFNVVIVLIIF